MQYLLMVYENGTVWDAMPDAEKRRISDACHDWHEDLQRRGVARGTIRLHPAASAATVRGRGGKTMVTDGPFAETKEIFGGLEIIECQDQAEAAEIAKTFPVLEAGFSVEIRQVMTNDEERQRWQEE
jgi:hypothetical protein